MLKPFKKTAELTFDLVKEIGQNGKNSKTYVSRDHQLDAEIVTKQIAKNTLYSPKEYFEESQALYASTHPNVVQIHYACYDNDNVYIAMPYYQSGSLKELMAQRRLTVREIVTFAVQCLSGLHNIHSKGLIHFDIKPDNILLSSRREAMLSDFGQAKQTNYSGVAVQDRLYGKMIPPEALNTDQLTRVFDIYQIGLTLYRMCNGNDDFNQQFSIYGPPATFDRKKFQYDLRNGNFPNRNMYVPHIPVKLQSVINKCLKIDPSDRYQSAIDVSNALAGIDGEILDWQLSEPNGTKVWTKKENGRYYSLTVKADGSSHFTKSINGCADRRILAGCVASLTDGDIRKLLTEH